MATTKTGTAHRARRRKPTRQELLQSLAESEVRAVVDELDAWHLCDETSSTAASVRMSKDKAGDAHGVRREAADELRHCLANGITLRPDPANGLPVFVDNNASASTFGKRKTGGVSTRLAFGRLLDLMRDGEVTTLIFTKSDRVARDHAELDELCAVADDAKLRGHTLTFQPLTASELDLNSALLRMVARILCSIGAGEVDQTRERVLNANRDQRDRGQYVGGFACMGLVVDKAAKGGLAFDKTPVGNSTVVDVVRDAVQAAIDGIGFTAIARRWEELGVPRPRADMAWDATQVRQRLDRPALAGLLTYQPPMDSQGQRQERYVYGKGEWTPVLSRAQWDAFQGRLARNRQGRAAPIRSRFTGLFVCPCGGSLYRHKGTWACMSGKLLPGEAKDGRHGCGRNRLDAAATAAAEAWVDDQAVARLLARNVGTEAPSADKDRLRSELDVEMANIAIYEEERSRNEMEHGEYKRLRGIAVRARDRLELELRTIEAEELGRRTGVDGLLDVSYEELDEAGKRKLIEAAFDNGILAKRGDVLRPLDETGNPETEEQAA